VISTLLILISSAFVAGTHAHSLSLFVCVCLCTVDLMPMAYGRLLGHYEQAVGFHEQAFVQNKLRKVDGVSILTYFQLCDIAMLFLKH